MLSRRQIRLFIRLGVLGMLTLKSGLFTCALKAGQILAPIAAKFPEVEQAVKAETHIKDLVNRLLSETNLLRQYSDADRMLQMEEFHLPTFLYVKTMLQRHRGKSTKPLFIGISAPQVTSLLYVVETFSLFCFTATSLVLMI